MTSSSSSSSSTSSSSEPPPERLRNAFGQELEQLRLQVEVMSVRVDEALQRSSEVLRHGDLELASKVLLGDDEIDAMLVSLTERCYELLVRQSPVASDRRLVVSVLRILSDLERVGDLCLRIVKLAPDHPLLVENPHTFQILQQMMEEAVSMFRTAFKAWAQRDLALARSLERRDDAMDTHNARLMEGIMMVDGPMAVPIAVKTLLAGRALERIADHSVMIGERLSYMLTGDVRSLVREVNPGRQER